VRVIVYGAGAVGGVVGGRLAEHGTDVVLVARGAHAEAMRRSGLVLESPEGRTVVAVPVATHPDQVRFGTGDVVLLAMKSQHTADALAALRPLVPDTTPVVCLQNGVANERAASARFANVYGVCVMCPTGHLEPGVVQAYSTPVTGILDIGRYPSGLDATAEMIAAALNNATFVSEGRPDIMRWKHAKLLTNLANAVQAVCGLDGAGRLLELAKAEGVASFRAAGIDFASDDEDRARRGSLLQMRPIGEGPRAGGSSWQSLRRRAGSIETDFLNGEIVDVGRRFGVETPVNALLQRLANEMAVRGDGPGTWSADEVLARL